MFKARKAAQEAQEARKAAQEAVTERRRRFQLFAAHGVPIGRNPHTPPRRG